MIANYLLYWQYGISVCVMYIFVHSSFIIIYLWMTQGQQRTEQNKQGLQRWKETIPTPPSGVVTSPGVQTTTTPHVSPSGQVV